jgi:hypothetical protein
MSPSDVDQRRSSFALYRAEGVHVTPTEAQADTVSHGSGSPLFSSLTSRSLGARPTAICGWSPNHTLIPTLIRGEPESDFSRSTIGLLESGISQDHPGN